MKTIALLLVVASASLLGNGASAAASATTTNAKSASEAGPLAEMSARKNLRRHRHVYRGYRYSYGYDAPYRQGYYRGVRPGWGYGPDPGDRAWPPFHFKPYW